MGQDDNTIFGGDNENQEESHPTNGETDEDSGVGNPPVARTSDGEPVWLNESKDGETLYLSVSREEEEDITIFPNNDFLRLAFEWIRRFQQK